MKSNVPPFSASTTTTSWTLLKKNHLTSTNSSLHQTNYANEDTHQCRPKRKRQHNQTNNQHTPNPVAQLRRADTWYFSADTFDVTGLHNTTKHYGPYTLHFTIHQQDRIDGTIIWIPPAMENETILQALRIVHETVSHKLKSVTV